MFVQSPQGFQPFETVRKITRPFYVELKFSDGRKLECAFHHRIKTPAGWSFAINLIEGEPVLSNDGFTCLEQKIIHYKTIDLFDLVNVHGNEYFTNGIVSHNCEFLGASDTLIDKSKLSAMVSKPPILEITPAVGVDLRQTGLKVFHQPVEGHQYIGVVDTCEGKGGDFSAIVIVDISVKPYEVVCTYRNNVIEPIALPDIVKSVGMHYNGAFILVEVKGDGKTVASTLWHQLEYENLLKTIKTPKGYALSYSTGHQSLLGVDTSASVKSTGCSNLKTIIEHDQLIVNDVEIVSEFSRFARSGSTFKAKSGHDDLVMCLVLFAWCVTQSLFESLTDDNFYQSIKAHLEAMSEENSLPLGVILRGTEDEMEEGGWQKVR